MDNFGFLKVAASTLELKCGDVEFNKQRIIETIKQANANAINLLVLPRFSITGGSANDIFFNTGFLNKIKSALKEIVSATAQRDMIVILGEHIRYFDKLFECAFVLSRGNVEAVVVNNDLTTDERRYFSEFNGEMQDIEYCGFLAPISTNMMIEIPQALTRVAVDFTNDFSKCNFLSQSGANLIVNLGLVNNLYNTDIILKTLALATSYQNSTVNIYAGSGKGIRTAVALQNSATIIAECGSILSYNDSFSNELLDCCFVDMEKINNLRRKKRFVQSDDFNLVTVNTVCPIKGFDRIVERQPLMLKNPEHIRAAFDIMAKSLYNRLKHTQAKKVLIGISGGLDSTLSLIVLRLMCDKYNYDVKDILAITMPSLASTSRTLGNAKLLIEKMGATHLDIPISDAITMHLKNIGHEGKEDIAYENAQARERTQILMDLANMHNGIMVGTSDMSEEALGFATYNGDAMSMYNIISGITKTCAQGLVLYYADSCNDNELKKLLIDIVNTPISPELKKGQKSEDYLGPYILHDFYLFNMIQNGFGFNKTLFLAEMAFKGVYTKAQLETALNTFVKRFCNSQYKRNVAPDGVKIFDISMSGFDYILSGEIDSNTLGE